MALTRFSLENYRCFQVRQEVELGLVTVVLGRNNSGKSALVRAPLAFSTGFEANSSLPLDLERLGEGAPSFQDLVYAGRPHGRVRLGFDFGETDDRTDVEVTVQHVDEWQSQVVSQLSVRRADASYGFSWSPEGEEPGVTNTYEVSVGSDPSSPHRVGFRGLFPDLAFAYEQLDGSVARHLAELSPVSELDTIRSLSPYRDRPSRMHRTERLVPPHYLPLRAIPRTMDFLAYARTVEETLPDQVDELVEEAERVAQRVKGYKVPVVRLVGGSLGQAVEVFSRINSSGQKMTPEQMVSALTYSNNGGGEPRRPGRGDPGTHCRRGSRGNSHHHHFPDGPRGRR